jgi:branched-chain amino acid transport system ATP-binding protein
MLRSEDLRVQGLRPQGLRVEDLHTYYGHGHILQGVSLEIAPGRIAAVLGRNGVGKTTTLRSIIGLTPPRRGRVLLGDRDVAGWPPHRIVRVGVGYVPEGRMILPDLTVAENIQVAQRVVSKQWSLERLFTLFPALAERRRHKGTQLSGGEQQMLAVARALATDPKVMLLDEPSQGLAPLVVEELTQLIAQLRDEGVSLLLVEQNLKLAEAVADVVYVMVKGRMVYDAPLARFRAEREEVKAKYLTL